jgi:hypothetical protein
MRTLFLWENCHMFDGQRAYWVEVPLEVFRSDIQGSVPGTCTYRDNLDAYLQRGDRAAEDFPDLVKNNHVYLLVREDGLVYEMPEQTTPYSPMWNAYCPFVMFHKKIASLSSLSRIDARDIDEALKKGRPMDGCGV